MIVVLNGPLGIGKSTLAEALAERMDGCVMLDGDALIAANPAYDNSLEHLHSTIALLVGHHRRFGYHHFVINHIWRSPQELTDLRRRFGPEADIRCFLLNLSLEENLQRIARRASARAIDELDHDRRTVVEEREALRVWDEGVLGEILEVDAMPSEVAERIIHRLGIG
jgi:shikimate kinase